MLELTNSSGARVADNFELFTEPYRMAIPESTVTFSVGTPAHDGSVPITLVASATAVFVTLTTEAQGRFSDNTLILPPGVTEVSFLPWSPVNLTVLSATLRVESLASYPMNV